jgi:hypothetical protein
MVATPVLTVMLHPLCWETNTGNTLLPDYGWGHFVESRFKSRMNPKRKSVYPHKNPSPDPLEREPSTFEVAWATLAQARALKVNCFNCSYLAARAASVTSTFRS